MKNKDTQLLEEAYAKVQLNEGMAETFLKPLFNKIARTLKEKAPEAFAKLASAKTPSELLEMVHPNGEHQQNESVMDAVNKVKETAAKFFAMMEDPQASTTAVVGFLHVLGMIFVYAAPYVAGGVMAVSGLLLACLASDSMSRE
jgi:hypothetical protein